MSVSMIFFRKIFNTNASTPDEMTQHVQAYLNSGPEDLKVDQIGDDDNVMVGNPEGLDFLEETTSDIERCNEERTSMKDAIAQLKNDMSQRKDRVRLLEAESSGRDMSRMRFRSIFKRDHQASQ
jgi:hypothetical protein